MYYRYGMKTHKRKLIKEDIEKGVNDDVIMSKFEVSKKQLDFIHDVLLKGKYRGGETIDSMLNEKIDIMTTVFTTNNDKFKNGRIVNFVDDKYARILFAGRDVPTLVNMEKMTFDTGSEKGKVMVV